MATALACIVAINTASIFVVRREAATTRYIEESRKASDQNTAAILGLCNLYALQDEYYGLTIDNPPPGDTAAKLLARLKLQQFAHSVLESDVCKGVDITYPQPTYTPIPNSPTTP